MRRSRCCSTRSISRRLGMDRRKPQTRQYVAQDFSPAFPAIAGLKPCATLCIFMLLGWCLGAQTQDEISTLLQQYVRIDTSSPQGNTTKAADFLAGVLRREG